MPFRAAFHELSTYQFLEYSLFKVCTLLLFSPQCTHDLELHHFMAIVANYYNNLAGPSSTCIKKFSLTSSVNLWDHLYALPADAKEVKVPHENQGLWFKNFVSCLKKALPTSSPWSGGHQQSPNTMPQFLVSPLILNHRLSTTLSSIPEKTSIYLRHYFTQMETSRLCPLSPSFLKCLYPSIHHKAPVLILF